MDLGTCPGCGQPWIVGSERCEHCGYVPIGVGVKEAAQALKEQQESKKRRRKVLIPVGSWPGYLVTLIAFLSLAFAADANPWRNDWEYVRVLFGDEPSKSLAGRWYVSRAEILDTSGLPIAQDRAFRGTFDFTDSGLVRIDISNSGGKEGGNGEYSLHGTKLYLRHLKNIQGASQALPRTLAISIDWTGEDEIVMDIAGHEVMYLERNSRNAAD